MEYGYFSNQNIREVKMSVSESNIEISKQTQLAVESNIFLNYLENLSLPTDNIIATTEERDIIANNNPVFVHNLPDEVKQNARYLSKFIGATAIGLFDAALNYIWNEVVLALRQKAITYGIDLFFDAAVGSPKREFFVSEDDLHSLRDAQLIDTCSKLELISRITSKKIKHILDMRNEIAASHPNAEAIGGYELLGWLDTCIKDIIRESCSESAIRVKAFIDQLKSYNDEIDEVTTNQLLNDIKKLSTPHIHNLAYTFFNWYTATDNNILKINITKFIPAVWAATMDPVRYNLGGRLDSFVTQLKTKEAENGNQFLVLVNGLRYKSITSRHAHLEYLSKELFCAHNGYDNFSTETIYMREILQYCHCASDIPESISYQLIHVIILCRLGRGFVSYSDGIGSSAKNLYDEFLKKFDSRCVAIALQCLWSDDILCKVDGYSRCRKHLTSILDIFSELVIDERSKEIITFIKSNINNIKNLNTDPTFIALTSCWDHNWQKTIHIL